MGVIQDMILGRLKGVLPRWFGDNTPNLDAVLSGPAQGLGTVYSLYQDVLLQLRISTATGGVLDLVGGDFYGIKMPRNAGESDDDYRSRILGGLFKTRATLKAMKSAIGSFTGVYPEIVEAEDPIDPSGYFITSGDDTTDGYGNVAKPHHAFITVYRIKGPLYGNIPGYNSMWGYGTAGAYIAQPTADYQALYQVINSVKPIGTKIWVKVIDGSLEYLSAEYGVLQYMEE